MARKPRLVTDIRGFMKARINWAGAVRRMNTIMCGKKDLETGAMPTIDQSIKIFEIAIRYSFGTPSQISEIDTDTKKAMVDFSNFISKATDDTENKAVSTSGDLVDVETVVNSTQPTVIKS